MRRVLLMILTLWVGPLFAQDAPSEAATLVADNVGFSSNTQLLSASGNVEITHQGSRLQAQSITYNGVTDQLEIVGPLTITDADGTIIVAEFAQLSGDLQVGVLQSARLVYARQLQIAAAEINRTDGRYTQLYKTVASSCYICEENPTPLWELRAKRIVHDTKERQLYFENAQLRVANVPIFYAPYLRLPGPDVERASGFLVPQLRYNGDYGWGLRTPYFFTLGDHADLTLTPWLTTRTGRTLEARYRRKLRFGEITAEGAVTDDDLTEQDLRSYLFVDGEFALAGGFDLTFDVELVSDPGYLLLYGYSEKDRLDSAINITRARRDELIVGELVNYNSLRDGDDNSLLPTIVGDAIYKRRFANLPIGGIASLSMEASGLVRRSSDPVDGVGRDVLRFSGVADWRRDWLMGNGMLFALETELRTDVYQVSQDDRPDFGNTVEVTPYAAVEWRWPMLRRSSKTTHLLEPVVQFAWADDSNRHVGNEDSLLPEFDEANLFRFNRFPGVDAQEEGARINLGLTYTRYAPSDWSLGLTIGRVIRLEDNDQFSVSTGLDGQGSDWLVAAQFKLGERLDVINRLLFDDEFTVSRNELRLDWTEDRYSLASTFAWLEADVDRGRPLDTSELSLDGDYELNPYWTLSGDLRYDFVTDSTTSAGIGVTYENECARVEFSVSRRFTSSTSLTPTTDFSMSVQLAGFGANGSSNKGFARRCNG